MSDPDISAELRDVPFSLVQLLLQVSLPSLFRAQLLLVTPLE